MWGWGWIWASWKIISMVTPDIFFLKGKMIDSLWNKPTSFLRKPRVLSHFVPYALNEVDLVPLGVVNTVKPVLSGHSKIDKTKVLKKNGRLVKVESIAECSKRAFCNTFHLY